MDLDVAAMWSPLMARFSAQPPPLVLGVTPPEGAEAVECPTTGAPSLAALTECLKTEDATRGVTLVFVGHGQSVDRRGVAEASEVCLGGQLVRVDALLAAIPPEVPWRLAIVIACYSANVDVRGARATSVLSSSPGRVAYDLSDTTSGRAASAIAMAVADALREIRDDGCDGVVSDQELHDQVLARLQQAAVPADGAALFDVTSFPRPRLRRDATATIPLFASSPTPECLQSQRVAERVANAPDQHPALRLGLQQQRRLVERQVGGELPASQTDFFFLADLDAHRECVAGRGRVWHEPRHAPYIVLCRVAIDQGLEPLSVPPLATREELRAFGRYLSFAEVYSISHADGWVHVDRMRDDRRLATRAFDRRVQAMPTRRQLIARSGSGEETFRVTFKATEASLGAATVCPQHDGQCFSAVSGASRP